MTPRCLFLRSVSLLAVVGLAGCARPAAPPPDTRLPGVTANSGGDTRGTILYEPAPPPATSADPYAALSSRFVIGQRQQMAAALTRMDTDAHAQAALKYPIPAPGTPRYSKQFASIRAQQQARLETQLVDQSHARFCNQYHLTYDDCLLLLQEAREKHWPLPPG